MSEQATSFTDACPLRCLGFFLSTAPCDPALLGQFQCLQAPTTPVSFLLDTLTSSEFEQEGA